MEKLTIDEHFLFELLKRYEILEALENGGVFKWEHYDEAIHNHIEKYLYDHDLHQDLSEREEEDFDIERIALADLKVYKASEKKRRDLINEK